MPKILITNNRSGLISLPHTRGESPLDLNVGVNPVDVATWEKCEKLALVPILMSEKVEARKGVDPSTVGKPKIVKGKIIADDGLRGLSPKQAADVIADTFDLRTLRNITNNGQFAIEANDMGAVNLLAGKVPFVAGPHLNVYNPQTLTLLSKLRATRWVMPVELSRESLHALQQHRPAAMATEVFSYGRLHCRHAVLPPAATIGIKIIVIFAASIIPMACR